jgi:hypothetical protein
MLQSYDYDEDDEALVMMTTMMMTMTTTDTKEESTPPMTKPPLQLRSGAKSSLQESSFNADQVRKTKTNYGNEP